MEEDVMNMDVAPVMMPDQQMPQGQQMMPGTPAAPALPEQVQAQLVVVVISLLLILLDTIMLLVLLMYT